MGDGVDGVSARPGIYVETRVRAGLDRLWPATQDAAAHTRWDLRFTSITDLDRPEDGSPKGFLYALRLPGRTVAGSGMSLGERWRPDGTCTSALRFSSPDPLSLIRHGQGWWRYVPVKGGTRFLTGYDYEPGWGPLGRVVDRLVFRRLIGWATAWSFDRLRLWLDEGVTPERSLRLGVADAMLRAAGVAVVVARPRAIAAWAAAVLAVAAPPLPGAPQASRCLRRAPDRLGRTAPRSLAGLAGPA